MSRKNRRNRTNRRNRRNSLKLTANRRRRKSTRKGGVRRTARRAYKKRRTNRKNGTRRGMRRKTARKAYKRRRNTVSSYLDAMPKSLQPLHAAMQKVPMIGKWTIPSGLGMAGAVPVALLAHQLKGMDYMAGKPVLQDLSYAICGLLGASLLSLGKQTKAKENLGFMLAVAGGSISAFKLLERYNPFGMFGGEGLLFSETLSEEVATQGLFMSPDYTYPTVPIDHPYNGVHMGDGGQWEVANFYHDAGLSDAHLAGDDLSASEGHSALRGYGFWCQAFPQPPKQIYGVQSAQSQHAGKEGHRWGWLIKMIGFQRFRKLASMKPADRMAMIRRLKKVAQESARKQFDASQKASTVPVISDNPMNGMGLDLSGLANDMAGVATVGAAL